jgi:hypothetical protein
LNFLCPIIAFVKNPGQLALIFDQTGLKMTGFQLELSFDQTGPKMMGFQPELSLIVQLGSKRHHF